MQTNLVLGNVYTGQELYKFLMSNRKYFLLSDGSFLPFSETEYHIKDILENQHLVFSEGLISEPTTMLKQNHAILVEKVS